MQSLLIVSAHPDDETFFAAGTLAKYAEAGARVAVLCATRGQRGSTAGVCSIEELPAVREQELRIAMQIVGVNDVRFLDYEDQQLISAPVQRIRRELVGVIRETQPQVVITFDPHGANGHTDHVAISRFVSDSVPAAADARWFPDLGPAHVVERLLWQPPSALIESPSRDNAVSESANLAAEPGFDFLVDITPWSDLKAGALAAHRTQVQSLRRIFFDSVNRERIVSVEAFRLAWGRRPNRLPSPDIFA